MKQMISNVFEIPKIDMEHFLHIQLCCIKFEHISLWHSVMDRVYLFQNLSDKLCIVV